MIYQQLARTSNWWLDNAVSTARLDRRVVDWVTDKGSLTTALTELAAGDFHVRVLRQRIALPYFHEQRKLSRALSKAAMIREVELCVYGEAAIFARSIIPLNLISKGRGGLANIGRTPLGHLLFKNGNIRVSKREFTQLGFRGDNIVARRTPYDYQGSRVLVSEFFLPHFQRLC